MNFAFLRQQQSLLETSPYCAVTQLTIQGFVREGQSSGISNILLLFSEVFLCCEETSVHFLFLNGVRGMILWSRCSVKVVGLITMMYRLEVRNVKWLLSTVHSHNMSCTL